MIKLITQTFTKVSNAVYRGLSGEIVSLPGVGLSVHDGVNFGGVLLQPQSATAFSGRDNFVRNSNFRSIQNGDSFVGNAAPATYTLDGWYILHNGGSASNVAQLAGYDSTTNSTSQLRVTTFSGDIDSSYSVLAQTYHTPSRFAGKRMTISYWIRSTVDTSIANEFTLTFADAGTQNKTVLIGRSDVVAFQWSKIEFTFDIPAITAGDVINNITDNARVLFWLDAGNDWNSRTGGMLPFSGTFDIANVKIEDADRATEYDASDILFQIQQVQEYFEKGSRIQYLPNIGTTQVDPLPSTVFGNVAFSNAKWTNLPTITYSTSNASGDVLFGRDSGGFTIQATATNDTVGAAITEYTANAEFTP